MDKSAESVKAQANTGANEAHSMPSFVLEGVQSYPERVPYGCRKLRQRIFLTPLVLCCAGAWFFTGCGQDNPQPNQPAAETKPVEPAIPEDIQSAADALLGKETTVLLFGDLAKNGKQEFLAANVVPKTPKNSLPGTIITRAVLAQNEDGKWMEILRCDEYLKNSKGYLPGTPLTGITGWRLAYDQDPDKGIALYFTPLKGTTESHQLPIGVRWNSETKRYQSLDRGYEHFLVESPSLGSARSSLR